MHLEGAAFAGWWADRYTRGLPAEVRDARRAEITSDVFEQCHGPATSDPHGRAVAWRTMRGAHADLAWRRQEMRRMQASIRPPSRIRTTWAVITQNWFAPLAALVGAFNLAFAVAVLNEDGGGSATGRVVGPILLVAASAALATGLWLRRRTGRASALGGSNRAAPAMVPARWVLFLVGLPVVLLALLAVGVGSGSPVPLVVAFALAVVSVCALGVRVVVRSARTSDPGTRIVLADGMIVLGLLPALGMFWMVIPPLLAIAVVVGVVTTNPRVRPVA